MTAGPSAVLAGCGEVWSASTSVVDDWVNGNVVKKGTGGGKARRKLVLGEPQPCPEETDLNDTVELEELLQLLKVGEDQPPTRPSTSPSDQHQTQNIVSAGASTSTTPGIVQAGAVLPSTATAGAATLITPGIVQAGGVLPNTASSGATTSIAPDILSSEGAPPSQKAISKLQEVRLPLGDNVFLTVGMSRNKPILNVRQFYYPDPADVNKMRPGKKGLALTPKQWAKLKALPLLGAILDATCNTMPYYFGAVEPKMYDLGSEKYVTVQILHGQPSVTLHQHYRPYGAPDTDPVMKRGIDLTIPQWEDLESKIKAVDKVLEAMENEKMPADKDVIQSVVY
ncbi:hypothetical protein Bbelb_201250 [Branchiostoma belcheri]|nr:hypothetical protein Bbelb_201250 [Branchiostoma belcheri]